MTIIEHESVVIGAGQAGLAMSYYLAEQERDHVVLEQGRLAGRWRSERWDSFTLVTPNNRTNLPGFPYPGDEPDGYMTKQELIAFFEAYAAAFDPPVRCGVRVTAVRTGGNGRFEVQTNGDLYRTANVVVATGILSVTNTPALSAALPKAIHQLHTADYRNPAALPPGNVLVVGSGQSGCQIAEELHRSGRTVYLCVGSNGRIPRRYRGKDVYDWTANARLNTSIPGKFSRHAYVSGAGGGHDLNLYQFARLGIVLLGRLLGVDGNCIHLASDLHENLRRADEFEQRFTQEVDAYIRQEGLDAPEDDREPVEPFFPPVVSALNVEEEKITTVLWATGYRPDFWWVHFPVFDESGTPQQERGITAVPGLYFLGMNWEERPKSAFVGAVGQEAAWVTNHIARRSSAIQR